MSNISSEMLENTCHANNNDMTETTEIENNTNPNNERTNSFGSKYALLAYDDYYCDLKFTCDLE